MLQSDHDDQSSTWQSTDGLDRDDGRDYDDYKGCDDKNGDHSETLSVHIFSCQSSSIHTYVSTE